MLRYRLQRLYLCMCVRIQMTFENEELILNTKFTCKSLIFNIIPFAYNTNIKHNL